MIEENGIYKLKKIKNFDANDIFDYKVIKMVGNIALCEKLNGPDAGERFTFLIDFLIDPEKPNDTEFDLIKTQ